MSEMKRIIESDTNLLCSGGIVSYLINNGQITDVWSWTMTRGKDQQF